MKRQLFLASMGFLFSPHLATQAETINHAQQYQACMTLVKKLPQEAFDAGISWKGLGGGEAAEHCIATALIAMEDYKTGAQKLEKLAETSRRTKEFKAQILAQAAQGWFLADQFDQARAVISTAIELDNTQAEFYVDRAQMRSAQNALNDAIEDLNTALVIDENNLDALVFRATIHRLLERFEEARADISKALALEPGHPEGLLERGMLYRIEGDKDNARKNWLKVITQSPDSPTAETARLNLQKMDLKEQPLQK